MTQAKKSETDWKSFDFALMPTKEQQEKMKRFHERLVPKRSNFVSDEEFETYETAYSIYLGSIDRMTKRLKEENNG